MKTLYLDCFSGISGDMALGALVDAGADQEYIEQQLKKIKAEPFHLSWKRVIKQGISALKVDVHTHTHEHENEHKNEHDHTHDHGHDHKHEHENNHSHDHDHHHRTYGDIVELIRQSGFNERVSSLSLQIFKKVAEAEAKIHQMSVENVHFHEVGAIDSIVDTVGVALAVDSLKIERIVCSPLPLGSGKVNCQHGTYPVPAPATLEIVKGIPLASSPFRVELTTPTGAGIVSALTDVFSEGLPAFQVESIGYGAGSRDLPNSPNVLRAVIGISNS